MWYNTTIEEGSAATWTGEYDPGKEYAFYWVEGAYSDECAFEILFGSEVVFTATCDECDNYFHDYRFFPVCEHSYNEGMGRCACTLQWQQFYSIHGISRCTYGVLLQRQNLNIIYLYTILMRKKFP